MALAAASSSIGTLLCTLIDDIQIPYYRLSGAAELVIAFGLLIVIIVQDEFSRVQKTQWKWIFLRGAFGCATMLFAWTAVAFGAPLGDASALGSVNVVVAALLGRAFLGEPLRCLHILALIASLVGAIFITRPESLTGAPRLDSYPIWLGYSLALAAGITSGGLFIASRKSQGISPLVMCLSVSLQEGVCLCIVASKGLVEDGPLDVLTTNPVKCMVWLVALLAVFLFAIVTMSVGSQICPAAASSTIYTSVSMSLGYVAQTYIHNLKPELFQIVGAVMMFLAVVFIAIDRWWHSKSTAARELSGFLLSGEVGRNNGVGVIEDLGSVDSHKSLASFIAAEFSGVSDLHCHSIRQRRAVVAAVQAIHTVSA